MSFISFSIQRFIRPYYGKNSPLIPQPFVQCPPDTRIEMEMFDCWTLSDQIKRSFTLKKVVDLFCATKICALSYFILKQGFVGRNERGAVDVWRILGKSILGKRIFQAMAIQNQKIFIYKILFVCIFFCFVLFVYIFLFKT